MTEALAKTRIVEINEEIGNLEIEHSEMPFDLDPKVFKKTDKRLNKRLQELNEELDKLLTLIKK